MVSNMHIRGLQKKMYVYTRFFFVFPLLKKVYYLLSFLIIVKQM